VTEIQVEVPQAVRDLLPEDARELYVATYVKSWDEYDPNNTTGMSREAVAARDAWMAINHEYVKDENTHQWHRKGESPTKPQLQKKRTVLIFLRNIFSRGS
jgi:cation transport regulator